MSTKILLADDHRLFRDGLRALIEQQSGMEVVGEAEDGRTAVDLTRRLSPDVVIMDVGMPILNGIEATRQIVAETPGVKVIALSMHSDRQFVTGMFGAGASGYLLKDCAFEELINALHSVIKNLTYMSPEISTIVVEDYVHRVSKSDDAIPDALTPRAREVLQLLAEGMNTKQLASHLNISVKTVEAHRRQIMEKLNLHSIAELTKYAIRTGLTSVEI